MANALYDPGREGILDDTISMTVGVIKVLLVRLTAGGTAVFTSSHKFVSDLTATHTVVATSAALSSKTYTSGIFDAADLTTAYAAVTANANGHVLVGIQASAVTGGADVATSAQRLIWWDDTGTNLPVVPNGGDIGITWDNTTNKIFKL